MSNAFTCDEHTNYYFDIKSEMLAEALDRLAIFFFEVIFWISLTTLLRLASAGT